MANASLLCRTNPHFFQPLLPGFDSHLNIPVKFFSDHIKGKHEGKTVNLRSDASERTWKVKMEGNRLTQGWKEFVEAHDLRVGDFVVFRHEGEMLFNVTALGPSCCEIQYAQPRRHEEDEESNDTEVPSRSEKEVDENVKTESDQSSPNLNCFSRSVTASNLSRDRVGFPINFAKQNGLNKERQEIFLMNEEGKTWESELKIWGDCRLSIVQGWTSFCTANKLEVGDSCTFRLLQKTAETPVFQLCSRTKSERKIQSAEGCLDDKTGGNRFVKLTPTPNSLHVGKQHLPVSFTRENRLINPGKIVLVDKNRAEWSMMLKVDKSTGLMYIISGNGWKHFCAANEIGAGESIILELIRGGVAPLLKFSSKLDQSPFEAEAQAHKRARVQKLSQETEPKLDMREKTAEDRVPPRASNKSSGNQENLQHTQPCSVSNQVAKVKQSVVDALTSIRRFRAELDTTEQKLEISLQEINKLERTEDNGNKTTTSSKPGATLAKDPLASEKQSTLPLPTKDGLPIDINLSFNIYTALRKLRTDLVREAPDGIMAYHIFINATLQEISRQIPRTKEELLQINGLWQAKVSKYGDRLLETIETTVNEYYGTKKKDPIIIHQ
ncbi:HRDC domain [Arabidopsis thaliana x Arabidopsis arenosa]|uniref:HRDC domain n=1 Tax=Arabidopsis thaliana x Arabidopsis arenosa TaxID=1240361 RepID=A0A8T1Y147_9BRAS|nr:HRDC domain [Arabidopsis thaliana x Arabidopsis arenosa]